MKAQLFLRSGCGILFALSLVASSSSIAQPSLQIRNHGMVIQSGGKTMVLNPGSSVSRSSSSNVTQVTSTSGSNFRITQTNSMQRSAVTLNSAALKQPHRLTISSPNGQLSGQVKLDNRVIQSLRGPRTVVNLSPYLSIGTKTIEISGKYAPARGAVRIEFAGAGTQVSQQSSGLGSFNHRLVVTVR